jgi:GNAT superfamily N-acetyltransferase
MATESTPARIVVRRVAESDIDALVSLCAQHARYERAGYDALGKADSLLRAIRAARLHVWIALRIDEPIGYASATVEYSTWVAAEYLHMDCLFVREGERGAGIGAALFASVIGFARECGCAQIQWQTPAWNEDAVRFYRRRGATGVEKIRFSLPVA